SDAQSCPFQPAPVGSAVARGGPEPARERAGGPSRSAVRKSGPPLRRATCGRVGPSLFRLIPFKSARTGPPKGAAPTMNPPVPRIDWARVMAFRTRRHHLHRRAPKRAMLNVVAAICGIQAQVMSSVGLAMWARIEGLTRADVRDALWKRRRLAKPWPCVACSTFCTPTTMCAGRQRLALLPITRSPDGLSFVDSQPGNSTRRWRQSAVHWDAGFAPVTGWPTRARDSHEPPSWGTSWDEVGVGC